MRNFVHNFIKVVCLLVFLIGGIVMAWFDGCIAHIDGE